MEHKLIHTENYLLVISDDEIKEGDLVLSCLLEVMPFCKNYTQSLYKKIIAHLPLNNSQPLQGVPLLPPIEDDIEKISEEEAKKLHDKSKHDDYDIYNQLVYEDKEMIKIGYNTAKEKYKYTKEDMRKAFLSGVGITGEGYNAEYSNGNDPDIEKEFGEQADKFIQSLSQPKLPIAFKCEMKCGRCYMPLDEKECWSAKECVQGSQSYPDKPKITTNSQGQEVLVGKYIY